MRHKLKIFIRTCSNVSRLSLRAFKFQSQEELIIECLSSLFKSCSLVKDRVIINIIDDSSPKEFRDKLRELLTKFNLNGKVIEISKGSYGGNYCFCLDLLEKSKEKLFLLTEDDYLYVENAIPYILEAYDNGIIGTDEFAIHPSDYIDRYEKIYPSFIFLGKNCHWRSIAESTGTFVITKKIFNKYKDLFYLHGQNVMEESSLNKIWQKVPLISPIPSLAGHLNYDTLPPFIDWEKILEKNIARNDKPKENFNKDNFLKKVKKQLKFINKHILHRAYLKKIQNNHLFAYNNLYWNKDNK